MANEDFANYVDYILPKDVVHINNNMRDPVPIVPGMSLGYHHCRGEIHIQVNGEWIACAGQDNPDLRCIVGTFSNIYEASFSDHRGPITVSP